MRNAIILHGAPEKDNYYDPKLPSESNAHWLPWLQKELIVWDIAAATPEVPLSFEPKWDLWCREVERYDINADTIIVGHSAGGGFWLKYLSQHKDLRVGKVVLVGPWLDPHKTLEEDFFAGDLDADLAKRTKSIIIYESDDDSDSVKESFRKITGSVKDVQVRSFSGYGHFTYDNLHGISFPELLQDVL